MSGETADLYFDAKENSTGTLMDGPDLALAGDVANVCVCVRVHSHKRPLTAAWQGHGSSLVIGWHQRRQVLNGTSVCLCLWVCSTLCNCICKPVHMCLWMLHYFQERFADLYTSSGRNPDSYSSRVILWQQSSKAEKLLALGVFESFLLTRHLQQLS